MNQLILLVLFVLGVLPFSEAQSNIRIKKLRGELKDELPDSSKSILQSQLAWELRKSSPAEADSLVKPLLSEPTTIRNDPPLAIGLAKRVAGYRNVAEGREAEGIIMYQEALELLLPLRYWEEAASVYLLLGNLMLQKGELDEAAENYYDGIRCADTCNCKLVRSIMYTRMARVKVLQKEYKTAKKYYQNAIFDQEEIGDSIKLARTYYNYGTLLAEMDNVTGAKIFFNKAERIFRINKRQKELATTLGALGNLSVVEENLNRALDYYYESLSISQLINDSLGIGNVNYQIGNCLYEQKNYEDAESYLNSALAIAVDRNNTEILTQVYLTLSELKEKINKPDQALKYFKQHIDIQNKIFTAETEKAIKEVEEKYENEKLLQENERQQALAERDMAVRNSIIAGLILGLVVAFGLIWYYYQKRKTAILMANQKEKIHEQEMMQMKQTAELRALNASQDGQEQERKRIAEALHNSMGSLLSAIQMHFQTLSETINFQKNDTQVLFDKSLQLVKEAAVKNRTIAHEMMPPVLMKFGLGAALGVLAEKIKGPNINVSTSVYGLNQRLPEQLELSLYRMIDELINNIVKHANASEVNIQMTAHEDGLNILVEDNGVGFNYQPNGMGYGIGLSSIMTRVNHFKGTFDVDSSEGNGTTIIIDIPDDTYR